jgi:hypothetical protein
MGWIGGRKVKKERKRVSLSLSPSLSFPPHHSGWLWTAEGTVVWMEQMVVCICRDGGYGGVDGACGRSRRWTGTRNSQVALLPTADLLSLQLAKRLEIQLNQSRTLGCPLSCLPGLRYGCDSAAQPKIRYEVLYRYQRLKANKLPQLRTSFP